MAGRHDMDRALAKISPSVRDELLVFAIRFARREELPRLLHPVLSAAQPQAQTALLLRLHEVPGEDSVALVAASPALDEKALASAIAQSDAQALRSLLDVVSLRRACGAAEALVAHLDAPGALGHRVAQILFALGVASAGEHGRAADDLAAREAMERVVASAAARWRHHRQAPIAALAVLLERRAGATLRELAQATDEPFLLAWRGAAEVLSATLTLRALNGGVAIRSARRGFIRAWLEAGPAVALEEGHLLKLPSWRRAIHALERPLRLLGGEWVVGNAPVHIQMGIVETIAALDLRSETRSAALERAAMQAHPLVRLAAARTAHALRGDAAPLSPAWLEGIAHQDPRLRRQTRRSAGEALDRMDWVMAARSAHHPWHDLARRRVAANDPRLLIEAGQDLPRALRHALARRHARERAALWHAALGNALESGNGALVSSALELVRVSAAEKALAHILALLTREQDPRISASAALLLGRSAAPMAEPALLALAQAPAPRVRANALEGLALAASPAALDLARSEVESMENRVRGNAVAILLTHAPARGMAELKRMLGDAEPMHRITALWVARTRRAVEGRAAIRVIAQSDADPGIRHRAVAVSRLLEIGGTR